MLSLRILDVNQLVNVYPNLNGDPRFLDITDVPFVLFAIVCLFVAYYKVKKGKVNEYIDEKPYETLDGFHVESYDILMQPKKDYTDSIPLTGTFPNVSFRKIFLGIALFIFYYLIFTESI